MLKLLANYVLISLAILSIESCTKSFIAENNNSVQQIDTITFKVHIQPLISSYCLNCHSNVNARGNLSLETYAQVRNSAENGNLIQRINNVANPMPISGLMSIENRTLFDDWVKNSYQEN